MLDNLVHFYVIEIDGKFDLNLACTIYNIELSHRFKTVVDLHV